MPGLQGLQEPQTLEEALVQAALERRLGALVGPFGQSPQPPNENFVGPPEAQPQPVPQLIGRQDEAQKHGYRDFLPLLIAQLADLGTTQETIAHPPQGMRNFEANPLPGMQSFGGRLAWGLAENVAADRLTRQHEALRSAAGLILPLVHFLLAGHNQALSASAGALR